MPKSILERLEQAASSQDPKTRRQLRRQLGTLRRANVTTLAALTHLLRDRQAPFRLRQTAAWAVGRLGDRRAVPALIAVLRQPDDPLWNHAWTASWFVRDARLQELFLELFQRLTDSERRCLVAHSFGYGPTRPAHMSALIRALANQADDPAVRGNVAESLGRLGRRRAVKPLIAALSDPEPEVRFWAAFALGQLDDRRALPELERLAKTDKAVVPRWGAVSHEAHDAIEKLR